MHILGILAFLKFEIIRNEINLKVITQEILVKNINFQSDWTYKKYFWKFLIIYFMIAKCFCQNTISAKVLFAQILWPDIFEDKKTWTKMIFRVILVEKNET